MPDFSLTAQFRTLPVRGLDAAALLQLSKDMKLSLSTEDMLSVQRHFVEINRDPTDVELEVIAQTWSEHCKHRIFGARVEYSRGGQEEVIDGLFKTFIRLPSERIFAQKPGFVLSAFHDNAGFIKLDDEHAVCLKVETHNHPSAIEPYAGANTGLGGVIRDILGAGKGAKPIASVDVFCFGAPDTPGERIKGDTIHPLGILRGVVRGVRDYGNRMGIPTVAGGLHFHEKYIFNPLVFCGTAGVIPSKDIPKGVKPGMAVVAVGGRTGRDGLKGATFSSAVLDGDSHVEDKSAVQIGNPIEEKKVCDFILHARAEGLIEGITDCGAGGFSSAGGEMVSACGGHIRLETCPLKEAGMRSWEIFLSESQERMVLAVNPASLPRIQELAAIYETEATVIGEANASGRLLVTHGDTVVCDLDGTFLHEAPRKHLRAETTPRIVSDEQIGSIATAGRDLRSLLASFNLCSREPIIREYDHEVQGNTVGKPLSGPGGDNPQDASVIDVEGSGRCIALSVALLPRYDALDPRRMGLATVDEAIRQLVTTGTDPDAIGILDNFCMGNPEDPRELGRLVETCRGISEAALGFGAPFISGKDSFYNTFQTDEGPVHIPVTILVSAIGLLRDRRHVVGASLRGGGRLLCLLGETRNETGGSAYAQLLGRDAGHVPGPDPVAALALYRRYHQAVTKGWILSAHDLSEGGLAVAAAEMGFSGTAGLELDLERVPQADDLEPQTLLFSESGGRILFEIDPAREGAVRRHFDGLPFAVIGRSVDAHRDLRVRRAGEPLLSEPLSELKRLWKHGLTPFY